MSKQRLIEAIVAKLEAELAVLERAVSAAREAATHEESKAEDPHDTRGLEASYLAGAQAARALELRQLIGMYKFLPLRTFRSDDPIGEGALVLLGFGGRKTYYFLAGQGGGLSVSIEGHTVQVITPKAPLGEALQGKRAGESCELEAQGNSREHEILSVT
ncbi:MAG: GreA/GreB family elongation factor [Oligoflexia bacterium]|nr:GreA/GreB family elongation factor [Oligoflexia bacterium]